MSPRLAASAVVASAVFLSLVVVACGGATSRGAAADASTSSVDATSDTFSPPASDAGAALDGPAEAVADAGSDAPALFSCAPASSFFDGGCGDPQTDPHNCGGCGVDCDGGACDGGACIPLASGVLATGQLLPIALAADGANVYWLSAGAETSPGGKLTPRVFGAQVLQCAATGCENRPTVLATYAPEYGIGAPVGGVPVATSALAVDAVNVYWTDPSSVHACAIGGCNCAPTTIAEISGSRPA